MATVLLIIGAWSASCSANTEGEKYVGTEWVWFTDYVYFLSEWTLEAESGCNLEVGVGVKFRGKPRGSITQFTGLYQFRTYGFGAIHVRAVSGRAPCLVRLGQGHVEAVGLYSNPSVIKGVIHDGKIIVSLNWI